MNLRGVFSCFQVVSDLNINLEKSKMVRNGKRRDDDFFDGLMGCRTVKLPLKYLDVPLGARHKDSGIWDPVIELFKRRLASWKRNLLKALYLTSSYIIYRLSQFR